jgi:hypothetical protein
MFSLLYSDTVRALLQFADVAEDAAVLFGPLSCGAVNEGAVTRRYCIVGVVRVDRIGDVHTQRDRVLGARYLRVQKYAAPHHPPCCTAWADVFGSEPFQQQVNFAINRLERVELASRGLLLIDPASSVATCIAPKST